MVLIVSLALLQNPNVEPKDVGFSVVLFRVKGVSATCKAPSLRSRSRFVQTGRENTGSQQCICHTAGNVSDKLHQSIWRWWCKIASAMIKSSACHLFMFYFQFKLKELSTLLITFQPICFFLNICQFDIFILVIIRDFKQTTPLYKVQTFTKRSFSAQQSSGN